MITIVYKDEQRNERSCKKFLSRIRKMNLLKTRGIHLLKQITPLSLLNLNIMIFYYQNLQKKKDFKKCINEAKTFILG